MCREWDRLILNRIDLLFYVLLFIRYLTLFIFHSKLVFLRALCYCLSTMGQENSTPVPSEAQPQQEPESLIGEPVTIFSGAKEYKERGVVPNKENYENYEFQSSEALENGIQ